MSNQDPDVTLIAREYGVVIGVDKKDVHPPDHRRWARLTFRETVDQAKMEKFALKSDPDFSDVRQSTQDVWLN